jgi:hypothetical protein
LQNRAHFFGSLQTTDFTHFEHFSIIFRNISNRFTFIFCAKIGVFARCSCDCDAFFSRRLSIRAIERRAIVWRVATTVCRHCFSHSTSFAICLSLSISMYFIVSNSLDAIVDSARRAADKIARKFVRLRPHRRHSPTQSTTQPLFS